MAVSCIRKKDAFRSRYLLALAAVVLTSNLALRGVLAVAFPGELPPGVSILSGLLAGFVNDLATLCFILLIPGTFILAVPGRFLKSKPGRGTCLGLLFFCNTAIIFGAFAEYFFWDEFHSRFNFIAVDYLLYTREVVQNIVESYPLPRLLSGVCLLGLASTAAAWMFIHGGSGKKSAGAISATPWSARLKALAAMYAMAGGVFLLFAPVGATPERAWSEYAKNGLYELFSAFRHNRLDYRAFYATMDTESAFSLMRSDIADASPIFTPEEGDSLIRMVAPAEKELRPNVIVVIMESMGNKWLGEYAPNLRALSGKGLSFTNMLSTGTRTVRGIEAVMLSLPPTPGNSIVRRPDNAGLFNLGTVFRDKGYDLSFIYGGIGYFDNMNAFFSGNGYRVVDKLDFTGKNKTFATAWGQCDEDLYAESLLQADAAFGRGRPFQQVLLTTSNHRPFTYPEGKVGLPPGSGRRGAVQYADYAIGTFLAEAAAKPWFDNTIFVFVGDHPSAIAGKTEVPADAYGIVCVFYGPKFFPPETVDTLCSQIDVAPTLFSRLGWEYRSQFFGTDARSLAKDDGRAWISTYQLLGYRTNDLLVVLGPNGKVETDQLSGNPSGTPEAVVEKAVASYQCAYDLYAAGKLREKSMAGYIPRLRAPRYGASSGADGKGVSGGPRRSGNAKEVGEPTQRVVSAGRGLQ